MSKAAQACPFSEFHVVREEKWTAHVAKCRKNYHGTDILICPFNEFHFLKKDQYADHEKSCPDRFAFYQRKGRHPDENADEKSVCLQPKTQSTREKTISQRRLQSNGSQKFIDERDFFPLGVMTGGNLPPQVKYSRGRGQFRKPRREVN